MALLVGALALGACGGPENEGVPSSPATQSGTMSDPHTMTGLTEAQSISDPTPLEGPITQQLPATVTDVEGQVVEVKRTERVLALDIYGTLSRTSISLGFGKNLVGRTVSSTENQLENLPVVTQNGHSLNVESILSLQPDLIIADRSIGPREAIDQLRSAGIAVVLVDSHRSLETNSELINQVAQAFGAPEAGEKLAERTEKEIDAALDQIEEWAPEKPLDGAFLYVRGTANVFFILGADEGAGALIGALGARDVATENGITSTTPANAESLVALNPEVIFVMSDGLNSAEGLDAILARPGISQTRAGANSRFVAIPDGMALSFGPQTGEALLSIARALYGVPGEE